MSYSKKSSQNKAPCCKVCFVRGFEELSRTHSTYDARGNNCCPTVAAFKCSYCDKLGHKENWCPAKKRQVNEDWKDNDRKKEEKKRLEKEEAERKRPAKKTAANPFAALDDEDEEEEEEAEYQDNSNAEEKALNDAMKYCQALSWCVTKEDVSKSVAVGGAVRPHAGVLNEKMCKVLHRPMFPSGCWADAVDSDEE